MANHRGGTRGMNKSRTGFLPMPFSSEAGTRFGSSQSGFEYPRPEAFYFIVLEREPYAAEFKTVDMQLT